MTPAQQSAAALAAELDAASKSLNRCPCGSKTVMLYTPGCTAIHCIAERTVKASTPDWNPTTLAQQWNQMTP